VEIWTLFIEVKEIEAEEAIHREIEYDEDGPHAHYTYHWTETAETDYGEVTIPYIGVEGETDAKILIPHIQEYLQAIGLISESDWIEEAESLVYEVWTPGQNCPLYRLYCS
jgi:hypothetical protein